MFNIIANVLGLYDVCSETLTFPVYYYLESPCCVQYGGGVSSGFAFGPSTSKNIIKLNIKVSLGSCWSSTALAEEEWSTRSNELE